MSTPRMRTYVPVIQRFATRVGLFHSAVAAKLGLNATDVNCLQLIGDKVMSAGEVSELIGLTGAATTALIDRLEKAGYVARERSTEDRRRVEIHVHSAKSREVNALYASQGERMERLLQKYSPREFEAILDFLDATSSALSAEMEALRKP